MANSISILFLTGDGLDYVVMAGILQRKWPKANIKRVDCTDALRQALNEAAWDAILLHEDASGLDLESVLAVHGEAIQKPVFVLLSDIPESAGTTAKPARGIDHVVNYNDTNQLISILAEMEDQATQHQKPEGETDPTTYERQFKSLIEISADTLLVIRPDGTLLYANPAAMGLFGRPTADLVGRNFGVTGGSSDPFDVEIVRPNGDRLLAEIRGSKVYWDGEDCQLVSLRDVTRRRKMEEALEESEARFSALLENAGDGIVTVNEKGVIEDFNSAAEEIFGWKRSEIVGKQVSTLFARDLLKNFSGLIKDSTDQTKPGRIGPDAIECIGKNRLGHAVALEVAASHFMFRGRKTFIGSIRDISDRKKMMRDLETSEERFRTAFNSAPDAIALTNLDGLILQVNPSFCHLTGYSESELLNNKLESVMHPEERETEHENKTSLITGRALSVERELRCLKKTGEEVLALAKSGLIHDANHNPIQILEHFSDITERRNLELQLRQSQKMEAIGQLTGGVAHDFNNLLGIVIGNLDLLQEELSGNTPAAHYADTALDASLRGAELNKQMLAFARRQPLADSMVDVGSMLHDMVGMIRRLVGERITVTTDIIGDCWPSKIDAAQLQTAIVNLALNARDAMPSGGALAIEAQQVEIDPAPSGQPREIAPGAYTLITVADTGEGMDPATLERVFEPFFTTKEVGKGTGLGLSMVFGFIKQSGGHISIDSDKGQGTAVHVYLPAIEATDKKNGASVAPADAPKGLGHTILIVEDNDRLREIAVSQLRKLNYSVVDASDGRAAMKIIESGEPIDLLFTDIVMPGPMDGVELSKLARSVLPDLPVVFASGFSDPSVISGISSSDIFLRKPYRRNELAAAISSAIEKRPYRKTPQISASWAGRALGVVQ